MEWECAESSEGYSNLEVDWEADDESGALSRRGGSTASSYGAIRRDPAPRRRSPCSPILVAVAALLLAGSVIFVSVEGVALDGPGPKNPLRRGVPWALRSPPPTAARAASRTNEATLETRTTDATAPAPTAAAPENATVTVAPTPAPTASSVPRLPPPARSAAGESGDKPDAFASYAPTQAPHDHGVVWSKGHRGGGSTVAAVFGALTVIFALICVYVATPHCFPEASLHADERRPLLERRVAPVKAEPARADEVPAPPVTFARIPAAPRVKSFVL